MAKPITITVQFSPELTEWMALATQLEAFLEDAAESQPWNAIEAEALIAQLKLYTRDTIRKSN